MKIPWKKIEQEDAALLGLVAVGAVGILFAPGEAAVAIAVAIYGVHEAHKRVTRRNAEPDSARRSKQTKGDTEVEEKKVEEVSQNG